VIVLFLGVLVTALGVLLLRRAHARNRSSLDTANNLASALTVLVIGVAMVAFGFLEVVG
jgi:NhaP-type Na+/H+ or K+/H+ antiporter